MSPNLLCAMHQSPRGGECFTGEKFKRIQRDCNDTSSLSSQAAWCGQICPLSVVIGAGLMA
jgi:hypothetical protein